MLKPLLKANLLNAILILLMVWALISCYPTRNVPEGSYLYTKSNYSIKDNNIASHNIESYFLQKTNSKILFIKPYVHIYDFGTWFKKDKWLYNTMTLKLGEAPVLYDSNLVEATSKNILQHLHNLGYYHTRVVPVVITYPYLKIAKVKYNIYPGTPYLIDDFDFDISNSHLRSFVLAEWNKSESDSGTLFSADRLQDERERLSKSIRNLGYYYFNQQVVSFDADTNFNSNKSNIVLKIGQQRIKTKDSIYYLDFKQYKFKNVYIYPEITKVDPEVPFDTTLIIYDADRKNSISYYFIHQGPMEVNPKAILHSVFVKPDRFYKEEDVAQTYQALYNLNIFKFVNVNIKDIKEEKNSIGYLDVIIQLSSNKKYSISSDSEFKNTGGDFGVEQGFTFMSRNTFKNGEIFKAGIRGALEVQNVTNAPNPNKILKIFNTFEMGFNTSLEVPRFLAPIRRNFFSRYFNPKTKIDLGYNYQDRPDYTRSIINASYGYIWHSKKYRHFILNPIEISSVKIYPEPEFQTIIDNYQDPRIKYSYQDHLVLGMSYSYQYTEMKTESKFPFHYFFYKIELGGIPYNFISNLFGHQSDSMGQQWVGSLPYTRFIRFETDYRYFLPISNGKLMNAFRANFGIGIPLGKSAALPFEKSFYSGGANSLRAWTLGTLGPGSYSSGSSTFEMTGDIKIEFNYEFRFSISGPLKGAIFADVGNIYLLKESDVLPGGTFYFKDFIPKLAADIGYGIRYDMSFLVIRADIAHPVYQPYFPPGQRWSMTTLDTSPKLKWAFNFAIGYPF